MEKRGFQIVFSVAEAFLLSVILVTPAHASIIDNIVNQIINPLIQLLLGAGLLVFLWGMVEFLRALDDTTAQATGKRHMVWGIIGLAIMISVFAIIRFLEDVVGSFS